MADIQAAVRRVNRLTALQLVQLYNWCQANVAALPPGLTMAQAAAHVGRELGFTVSDGNLRDALRQLEIRLPTPDRAPEEILRARQGILKRAVEALYKNLNLPLPPDWVDM